LVVAVGVSDLEDDDVLICNLFAERIWSSLCLASDVGISVGAGAGVIGGANSSTTVSPESESDIQ